MDKRGTTGSPGGAEPGERGSRTPASCPPHAWVVAPQLRAGAEAGRLGFIQAGWCGLRASGRSNRLGPRAPARSGQPAGAQCPASLQLWVGSGAPGLEQDRMRAPTPGPSPAGRGEWRSPVGRSCQDAWDLAPDLGGEVPRAGAGSSSSGQ